MNHPSRGASQFGGEDSAGFNNHSTGGIGTRFNHNASIDLNNHNDDLTYQTIDTSFYEAPSPEAQPAYHPYDQSVFVLNSLPANYRIPTYHEYPAPLVVRHNRSVSAGSQNETSEQGSYQYPPPPDYSRPVLVHQPNRPSYDYNYRPVSLPLRLPTRTGQEYGNDVIAGASLTSQIDYHARSRRPESNGSQNEAPFLENTGAGSRRKRRPQANSPSAASTPSERGPAESVAGSPSAQPPVQPTQYIILGNGAQDPTRRGKKAPSAEQKKTQEEMIEIGGACVWCSEKRKTCNLLSPCSPCQAAGVRCVRHQFEFWLLKAPTIQLPQKGSLNKALEKAKVDTFKDICSILRDLSGVPQAALDGKNIVLQVVTDANPLAPSQSLDMHYTDLFEHSHTQRDDFSTKLVHTIHRFVPQAMLPLFDRMETNKSYNEAKILRLIQTAWKDVSLIQRLGDSKIHCAIGEQPVAKALGGFICASLVKNLGIITEKLCDELRERLRHKKGHYAETRYAVAAYYLIVKALMDVETSSAIDDIVNALRTQLPSVRSILQSLFDKTTDTLKNDKKKMLTDLKKPKKSGRAQAVRSVNEQFQGMLDVHQDLEAFISDFVPEITTSPLLHFAFYIAHEDGLPVSSRAARQLNPFDHRNPLSFSDLLQRTAFDPASLSASSSNDIPTSLVSPYASSRLHLPRIETLFTPDASSKPSLTETNLHSLAAKSKIDSRLLSPSTARYVHHASLRTSQAGTAISSFAESSTTFAISPQVFEESDSHIPILMTKEEKILDFESLQMTQEKPLARSTFRIGNKQSHSPNSDVSPASMTFPPRRQNEVDNLDTLDTFAFQEFHEGAFANDWDGSFGEGDWSTKDAIHNRAILSSAEFSSHPTQDDA